MKGNKHNIRAFFTHQLDTWDEIRQRYEALKYVGLKQLGHRQLQYNPARMVSTGAQIDRQTIAQRACFLCEKSFQKYSIVPKGKSVGYR